MVMFGGRDRLLLWVEAQGIDVGWKARATGSYFTKHGGRLTKIDWRGFYCDSQSASTAKVSYRYLLM